MSKQLKNHIRIDLIEQHIVDAIVAIRKFSKRPDEESIFKYISISNARIKWIKEQGKLGNKQTRKSLDFLFLVGDQPNLDSNSELLILSLSEVQKKDI